MDCLIDRIGLEGCGANTPTSSLFINSLPGISIKSIHGLTDAERSTAIEVWNNIQQRGIKKFVTAVRAEMGKKYKLASATQSVNLGRNVDPTIVTPSNAALLYGVVFDFGRGISENYDRSKFLTHYVKEISYYSTDALSTSIAIIDPLTNDNLWQTSYSPTNTGWQTINVDKLFTAQSIFVCIGYGGNDKTDLFIQDGLSCSESCRAYVTGAYGQLATSLTETNNTGGLSVVYSAVCKFDRILCELSDTFDLPLWYSLGSELMMERMASDRVNKWTVNRDQAAELKAFYDAEFERTLSQAIGGLNIGYDCCLVCDPQMAIRDSPLFGC